jgi:TonB family protein
MRLITALLGAALVPAQATAEGLPDLTPELVGVGAVVCIRIDDAGNVSGASMETSTGDEAKDRAVIAWVRQLHWDPPTPGETPRNQWFPMPIAFGEASAPAPPPGCGPVEAGESIVAADLESGARVYLRIADGRLHLRGVGPNHIFMGWAFDANANGRVDEDVDVKYGFDPGGAFCPQQWLSEGTYSTCGGFPSTGRGSRQSEGETTVTRVNVPLSEVSRDGKNFGFAFQFWDNRTRARRIIRGRFAIPPLAR